jgi:hypothetical protein
MNSTFVPDYYTYPELWGDAVVETVDPKTLTAGQLAELTEEAAFIIVRLPDGGLSMECPDSLTRYPPDPEPVASGLASELPPCPPGPPWATAQPGASMLREELAHVLGDVHVVDWSTLWPALLAGVEQRLGRPLFEAERAQILAGDVEVTWLPAGFLRSMGGLPDVTYRGGGSVVVGCSTYLYGGSG